MKIQVGARSSPLSLAQVKEVEIELKEFASHVKLHLRLFETTGDKDLKTSLRNLEKTNFFTKEIDEALLLGEIDIAIHSAKDLPDPLPKGLSIYAITKGVDSRDSLVMDPSYTLETLPQGAKIGTSSLRREEYLLSLRSDFQMVDIRGAIHERLSLLEKGEVDGVVIAEAALIRLGLSQIHREILECPTAPFQGCLAVVGRAGNPLEYLFECMDTRQSV